MYFVFCFLFFVFYITKDTKSSSSYSLHLGETVGVKEGETVGVKEGETLSSFISTSLILLYRLYIFTVNILFSSISFLFKKFFS
jgi:hypothetical protein